MVVLTVQQVLKLLRELIETNETLNDVWVTGEVSNLSRSAAGHVYFTLKDGGGQLRCVFFRQYSRGMQLQHGDEIAAHGRATLYEQRGELNFTVDFIHPRGAGALNAQFERLKQLLEAEGLFAPERKRPLPLFPRRIGIITSPTGAVLHDLTIVIGRRWPLAEIVLAPSPVQGDAAPAGVVEALQGLNACGDIDVIVIARGGGSLEELAAFNDERVARAVYASRVPIVSAVGHETDYTLCDFAADLRAPTPSVAGELIVPDRVDFALRVGALAAELSAGVHGLMDDCQNRLERLDDRLQRAEPDLGARRLDVATLMAQAESALRRELERRRDGVGRFELQLATLDPRAVLRRGYAVVQRADGSHAGAAASLSTGERVTLRFRDGALPAEIQPASSGTPSPARRGDRPSRVAATELQAVLPLDAPG